MPFKLATARTFPASTQMKLFLYIFLAAAVATVLPFVDAAAPVFGLYAIDSVGSGDVHTPQNYE